MKLTPGVIWKDWLSSEEVAKRCALNEFHGKTRQGELHWFGHVRREAKSGVLVWVDNIEVAGIKG